MHNDIPMQNPAMNEPEGAMSKADLYRAAKSAIKLFELFYDDQQLEGWVQAKISKAADYLDSVYHYMEFQMKFGPQGSPQGHDSVESLTGDAPKPEISLEGVEESVTYEDQLRSLLESACKKEKKIAEISDKKKKDYRAAAGKDMKKSAEKGDKSAVSKRLKGLSSSLKEEDKQAKKDYDNDGEVESEKDEVWGSRMKAAKKSDKKVDEAKPSAGMSKKEKSSVVKKAKAGKDIGKPGKGFEKVASKAAKQYGSKEKGEKVAAAAMWKQQAKK